MRSFTAVPHVFFLLIAFLVGPVSDSWAVGSYRFTVPNGDQFSCTLCHLTNPPGFPFDLNAFGTDVRVSFSSGGGAPQWNSDLAKKDSDGDGYTNGEELQEATGNLFAWEPRRTGSADTDWDGSSGIPSLVRNPGDCTLSVPGVRFDPIRQEDLAVYVDGRNDESRTRTDSVNVGERIQITLSAQSTVPNRSLSLRLLGAAAELEGVQLNILTRENLLSGDVTRYLNVERITASLTWSPSEQQGGDQVLGIELTDGTSVPVQTVRLSVFGGILRPSETEPPVPPPPVRVSDFTVASFDFNNSLVVDLSDFALFAQSFGLSASRAGRFDFDKSGLVDWRDFLFFTYFYTKRVNNDIYHRSPARDQVTFVPVGGGRYVQEIDGLFQQINIPAHEITKTEIVNRQYNLFLTNQNNAFDLTPAPFNGTVFSLRAAELPDHPVVGVSWEMANGYCKWLSGRLPTLAEWNFAARGTTLRSYAHGDRTASNQANFLNSGDPFEPGTTPPSAITMGGINKATRPLTPFHSTGPMT